ncbi:MAG: tetratricopeptide repeat protein [Phycisphaerae bacterium]|nr:tetratricopeptide repeat protein [Phycisphaerae bacterium]
MAKNTSGKTKNNTQGDSRRLSARVRVAAILLAAIVVASVALYIAFSPDKTVAPDSGPRPLTPAELAISQARNLMAIGETKVALEGLKQFVKNNPGDTVVRPTLARIYLHINQPDKATEQMDIMLKAVPNHPKALWIKGLIAFAGGGDGMKFFRRAAEQETAGAMIWGNFGMMMTDKKDTATARPYLIKAVEAGTSDARIYVALGQIAFEENRFDEAYTYLKEATVKNPEYARGWALLGEVQKNLGESEAAMASLRKAAKYASGVERAGVLVQLGQLLKTRKDWAGAAKAFARAVDYPAMRQSAALEAAKCYYFAQKYALAMKNIDVAAKMNAPTDEIRAWKLKIEDARFGPEKTAGAPAGSLLDTLPGLDPKKPKESPKK